VIKAVMAMREGVLPKSLHIDQPSSKVEWDQGQIELLSQERPWDENGGPRRAAVSSFGISGTNAHLILEGAPEPAGDRDGESDGPGAPSEELAVIPLAISAKTDEALTAQAKRLATHLQENPELDPTDLAYSLTTTRSSFEQRAVVVGESREELLESLSSLAEGGQPPTATIAQAKSGKLAYLLTGQGSQRAGMGKELYETYPAYREAMDEVCEHLDPHMQRPLKELLFAEQGSKEAELLNHTTYAQPALFALGLSLHRLLESKGLKPDLLAGHSVGEIAAAQISGVLSLKDAAKLIATRGRLMGELPTGGAMAAIEATEAELKEAIQGKGQELSIAAINGPTSTVASGNQEAIEELVESFKDKGRKTKRLQVSHAFHSPLIEPMLKEFEELARSLAYQEPKIPIVSNTTGELLTPQQATDPAYWAAHAREPVRFADTVATLGDQATTTYIELGPDPVLSAIAGELLADQEGQSPGFAPTLREGRSEPQTLTQAIATAHANGARVDWGAFFKDTGAKRVPLPTYPFQGKRFWLSSSLSGTGDASGAGLTDPEHPLLGAVIEDPEGQGLTLTARLSIATHPWLADHAVAGTTLLPATAFLELALTAAERLDCQEVTELAIAAPLIVPEVGSIALQVSVSGPGDGGQREIQVHSRPDREEAEWTLNATGSLSPEPVQTPEPLDAWPPEGAEQVETELLYDRLAEAGFEYGEAFQGLTAAWKQGEEIYAEVSLPEGQAASAERFCLHPALFDAALHAIFLADGSGEAHLPFAWGGVSLNGSGATELRVTLRPLAQDRLSLSLHDREGLPIARIASLSLRSLDLSQLNDQGRGKVEDGLLSISWQELSPAQEPVAFETTTDLSALGAEEGAEPPSLLLWEPGKARGKDLAKEVLSLAESTLTQVQAFLADERLANTRLAIATEGAVSTAGDESPDLPAAALWGLLRSAQSEHPGRLVLLDSDGSEASGEAIGLALALEEEPQLAIREGRVLAPRALSPQAEDGELIPPPGPWRLDAPTRGSLQGLTLVENAEAARSLGPTEVRIQMRAAGLNFRDVLITLGQYPGKAEIGNEGAGVVVEVGEQIGDLVPGERVMGIFADAFAPLAVAERELLVRVPEGWSDEQAAALPTVFATALYGLADLAELKAGEKVLIHAGAGGVGTAAVQIAKHLGAEVFATASPTKWEHLEAMGLDPDHIATSRDLDFKEKFFETTGGEGVDVVLNALAGEYVDASLSLLPNGGRFLEMGKADIRDPGQIEASHPGVSYRAFDLVEAGPKRITEMLSEILALFEQGALAHSTITSWPIERAPEAFRALREGANVGKLVLELPLPLDPEKTILISGATGALGSLIARHLVISHGARHLLLASRSGRGAKGAKELAEELGALGAEVNLQACDVSDREELEALLAKIDAAHPLGAVFHAAGVLEDATFESLSPEQLEPVFAPKASAAWNLHQLTEDQKLSAFVCFSSAAGVMGAPGQANYAAANSFLDALAQRRRAEGLPATSIAWGLWERESSMTEALSDADRARMSRSGIAALSDERGLELFDRALAQGQPLVLAMGLERSGLRSLAQAGLLPPLLSGLVRTPAKRRSAGSSLAKRLASMPEEEQLDFTLELVRAEVAAVLGHGSAEEIDPGRAFKDLGFDSLAAVELRNRLATATGLRLAATTVFDYPSSQDLAEQLLAEASQSAPTAKLTVRAQSSEESIAIVGMACRYPRAVSSPEELWALVAQGRETVEEFPLDRGWDADLYHPDPDHPGTTYCTRGGFLAEPGHFDAEFFGISPREALAMDPQQRLLLESSWEALEAAGIDPVSLRGEHAGVFAGLGGPAMAQGRSPAEDELEGYHLTGTITSVASGRIAYALGLEGPAITVDTACSSSLVAIHLAAQALRGGECDLALAGGATVLGTPRLFTEFSRQRGLSPDGRCKSFSEAADGVGISEGVGMLVLARLSEAERRGLPILATIRGSAVNQDGASNGLTAPNGPSQERVIRQALANARLEPSEVQMVEAHGTGTTLGDPIEAGALLATYGQEREEPLYLGSVKSNIGHTQAAAGVAGVIKAVMAMREGVLPKSLHIDQPSSKVEWEAGQIELLSEERPWDENGGPRRAAVSSFGISGTNAHLILEGAPEPAGDRDVGESDGAGAPSGAQSPPLILSAKTDEALAAQAQRLIAHIEANPELSPIDLAYSLTATRSSFERRAVVAGEGRSDLLEGLSSLAAGADSPILARGIAPAEQAPVFIFAGQGTQHAQMARELLDSSSVFAASIEECEEALSPFVDWSLQEVLREADSDWLDRLEVVQPALFAVMVSLARLWQSVGVRPAGVVGHSQGEIAAAHIAGGLSLEDAARLAAVRSRTMLRLSGLGTMISVSSPAKELEAWLGDWPEMVFVAAQNGPASTILSAKSEAVDMLLERCEEEGVRARRIPGAIMPSHTVCVEPLRDELLEVLAPTAPRSGEIPFYSTVTGGLLDTQELDAEYWYQNLRQPVLFEPVVRGLLEQGRRLFVEISPHPVFALTVEETIEDALGDPRGATVLGTLRRGEGSAERFARSLGEAHAHGAGVDWGAFFAETGARAVKLPTYPFQGRRYWLSSNPGSGGDARAFGLTDPEHPLLGAVIEDPAAEGLTMTARLSLDTHPWLTDHAFAGTVLLPATAFLELALAAAERLGQEQVSELTIAAPLILPEQGSVALQISVGGPDEEGSREIRFHSRPEREEDTEWTLHASGSLSPERISAPDPFDAWPPPGAHAIETEHLYDRLAEAGFDYGPAFQGLGAAWKAGEEIYAEVRLADEHASSAERFCIHPALSDAALHAIFLSAGDAEPHLPFAWSGVSLHGGGAGELRAVLRPDREDRLSLALFDGDGAPVAAIESLSLRAIDPAQLEAQGKGGAKGELLSISWQELPPTQEPVSFERTAELSALGGGEEADPPALLLWEPGRARGKDPVGAALSLAESALVQVQAFLADERFANTRLAIATEAAVSIEASESPDLPAAALWGLLRSAQSEHPGRFVLLDSDGSDASAEAIGVALAQGEEPQLAIREGRVLAPRVLSPQAGEGELIAPAGPWRLDAPSRGSLQNLALVESPEATRPLGPTEVRIAVRAAGLNFRDVLIALGQYPIEGAIGSEGAGVVVEVGEQVDDLAPGERVMGVFADAFAPLAVAERELLVPVPEGWSDGQAAALPTVFATALYGLADLAGLKAGEKVLIHAGTGGVGTAAIQIAKHMGAEVFATASPSKWEHLREAGIAEDHIASSRDLDFAEKFLETTGGEGVDVVLNALAGKYVDASLSLLPNGGRFLEMGKADVRDPEQIEASHPGVSYRAFDLAQAGPKRIAEMLAEILALVERGALAHSPVTSWPIERAPEAFRALREGANVGKLVLELPRPLDPEKTILITGATGGLGSLVARHLVEEHGARHLLLASRSGSKAKGAGELLEELGRLGARAQLAACDVSDRDELEELLAKIDGAHPLGAVFHAAGVLEDATFESLSPEQIEPVFAPKASAAWNLHELTEDQALSAFVCFSSAAGVTGAPGQANYAAANSFLDALAQRRRAEGLPATSIAWGLWERESSMGEALGDADKARMARSGMAALTDAQGLELLDQGLLSQAPFALALRLQRGGLRSLAQAGLLPPLLSGLVRTPARRRASSPLVQQLAAIPAEKHEAHVLELVLSEVAAVLGHGSSKEVDPEKAFKDLGFDSLAAVELRNRLAAATGLRLAATTVFDYPSPTVLTLFLVESASASGADRPVVDSEERELREALASIPIAHLRRAGLIDPLLRLASTEGDGDAEAADDGDAIDAMDVAELVRESVGGSAEGATR
jgi:acyl transferase domain-containing protein/NADPH:quinone reductase-like Zn-dependent oxidoreductase/acyl carrier protein